MVPCSHCKKFQGFSRKFLGMIGDHLIYWQGDGYNLLSLLLFSSDKSCDKFWRLEKLPPILLFLYSLNALIFCLILFLIKSFIEGGSLSSISIILLCTKFVKILITTSLIAFTCSCILFKWNKTSQLTVRSAYFMQTLFTFL